MFWSVLYELYPSLVEIINEATLITGDPEVRSTSLTAIALNSTFQTMPDGVLALLRVEGSNGIPIQKVSVWDLDQEKSDWENDTDVSIGLQAGAIKYWFPFGLTQWGVYPQLTAGQNVILSYIATPVPSGSIIPPWDGSQIVPFQEEYDLGFIAGAAALLRMKEGGKELQEGLADYQAFLDQMTEASKFAWRKGSLSISRVFGPMAGITEVTTK